MNRPANYGLNLPGIYLVWLCVVVLALYAPCRWFASLKQPRVVVELSLNAGSSRS